MLATHADAEKRYEILRKTAIEIAYSDLSPQEKSQFKFNIINQSALNATIDWGKSPARRVNWDWIDGYAAFKFRYPKRFETAIWFQEKLINISMGRPTYNGNSLRLDFVEASPKDLGERPSVFNEVLVAYGIYARMINAKQIRIMNPINNDVKKYYESFGYTYIAKKDYLYREVT